MKEVKYTLPEVMEIIKEGLRATNKEIGLKTRLYSKDWQIIGAVSNTFNLHKMKSDGKKKSS